MKRARLLESAAQSPAQPLKFERLRKIEDKSLHLTITFYAPKKNQRYDLDNALASIKAGLDGISAIVGVDDGQWSLTIKKGGQVGGMVKVLIERVEDATAQ